LKLLSVFKKILMMMLCHNVIYREDKKEIII
jgi:hypothetical protein